MELIDRDRAKEALRESYCALAKIRTGLTDKEARQIAEAQMSTFVEAIERIKEQPAVDAVAVVRCKECRHWNENGWCRLIGQEFDRWPAYYCAEGVRKGKI